MKTSAPVLHRKATVVTLAIGVLLVSGCAGQQDSEQPAAAETAAAAPTETSPAPTSTPTPAEPDLEDPSSWLIDFTAIGPLALQGQVSEEATSMTAFTSATQDACPSVSAFDRADSPSIWLPDPTATGIVEQIVLQSWGTEAAVSANSPQTSTGIGIGATRDQLTAAYPQIEESAGTYAPVYSVPDNAGHWINFALSADGLVDTIVVRDTAAIDSEYCG